MVSIKKTSRRQPVRRRHKIEKRVAEHKRKETKQGKKDVTWKSKNKKDIGIPNSFPFKGKLLAEIEERKRVAAESAAREREERNRARKALKDNTAANTSTDKDVANELMEQAEDDNDEMDVEDEGPSSIAAFAASIAQRYAEDGENSMDHDDANDEEDEDGEEWSGFDNHNSANITTTEHSLKKETSRRMFDRDYKQVVADSDVVLYVLDARDPEGTRSREVEALVLRSDRGEKRLMLILNKIDLVPSGILETWLKTLRASFPTLPLRSNGHGNGHNRGLTQGSTCGKVVDALKAYARKLGLKRAITVGVLGFPNVGKSSLVNALTSRTVSRNGNGPCTTGAEAGVTRSVKRVTLDKSLALLDAPGIVFTRSERTRDNEAQLVLNGAIPTNQIVDPIPAATLILDRLSAVPELYEGMVKMYDLPPIAPGSTTDFLIAVARKRGRLGRGGIPDLGSAARAVLADWRAGRITWYTLPRPAPAVPAAVTKAVTVTVTSEPVDGLSIASCWAAEFDLGLD